MRILLIKPKHIGDTLILTPTITGIRQAYPDAEIWVLVRQGTEGMLAGCPGIARVLTLAGVEKHERTFSDGWRQLKILAQLWSVKFDYVFELGDGHRGRLFALLVRAARRYSVRPASPLKDFEARRFSGISPFDAGAVHRVEKDYLTVSEFLPLPAEIPPLCFQREATRGWPPADRLASFAVMQIGKRQAASRWHREGWEQLGAYLIDRIGAVVICSGSADYEVADAQYLREKLGPRAISTLGQADWPQVAGMLYRARLYVGLDTATMHLAAACNCPVVALFGPTLEHHWHPWRVAHRIVTSRRYYPDEDLAAREAGIRARRMEDIGVRAVVVDCEELMAETESTRFRTTRLPDQPSS